MTTGAGVLMRMVGMNVGVSGINEKMTVSTWLSKINLLKDGGNKHNLPHP